MNDVDPLFARPVIPVANEADAELTAEAAFPHLAAAGGRATVVHVIEKGGGAPDKAPLEAREEMAEGIFEAVRTAAAAADVDVETDLRYGTDVAEAIVAAARETDATAIVFCPRDGKAWWKLLGDRVRESLVSLSDRPVVVLPRPASDGSDRDDTPTSDGEGAA